VDRVWSLWAEIYRNESSLSRPFTLGRDTFGAAAGTLMTPNSPLFPFFGPGDRPLTCGDGKRLGSFGYTYPEIDVTKSPDERRKAAIETMNRYYHSSTTGVRGRGEAIESATADIPSETKQYSAKVSLTMGGNITAPCLMNVYLGGQQAGSFSVLEAATGETVGGLIPLNQAAMAFKGRWRKGRVWDAMSGSINVEIVKACLVFLVVFLWPFTSQQKHQLTTQSPAG
jgi:hypothetical protein